MRAWTSSPSTRRSIPSATTISSSNRPRGQSSEAQIEAFEDTWHWNEQAEREYEKIVHGANTGLSQMIQALRSFLGEDDMMANRLLELQWLTINPQ